MKQEIENITEAINYWYFDVRRSSCPDSVDLSMLC